jgi:hypothetical protein
MPPHRTRDPRQTFLAAGLLAGLTLALGVIAPAAAEPAARRAGAGRAPVLRTPLVVEIERNGLKTTTLTQGIRFDFEGTLAPVRTAWLVGEGAAMLALDLDDDGMITNGAELFGSHTPMPGGGTADNGFEALARYDENKDGVIDAKDPVFSRLRLWVDRDKNGIGEGPELTTLARETIEAIELKHVRRTEVDRNGNILGERGVFRRKGGLRGRIIDVYLRGEPQAPAHGDAIL